MKKLISTVVFALLAACGSSERRRLGRHHSRQAERIHCWQRRRSVRHDGRLRRHDHGHRLRRHATSVHQISCRPSSSRSSRPSPRSTGRQRRCPTSNRSDQSFQTESDAFDTQSSAAGCNKYNLTGSDAEQLKQVVDLAAKDAPGTVPFLTFLASLTDSTASTAGTVPSDCQSDIAAIETYLGKGTTMKDLTMTEVTQFGKLMTAVTNNCTPEESQAFASRADVTAFISG